MNRLSLTFLLTGALALPLSAACGGDDDAGEDNPDANPGDPDANDTDAAPPPELLRSGTLAITETRIAGAARGQLNVISFNDETTRTVAPVAGFESPINGCAVVVYSVEDDEQEPDIADGEGMVTVTGTTAGEFECN